MTTSRTVAKTAVVTRSRIGRVPVLLSYRDRGSFLSNYWQKNGEAGVFVPGNASLDMGDLVDLEIAFASPKMIFQARGEVRWKRPVGNAALASGVGVAFRPDDPQTHDVIVEFATGRAQRDLTCRSRRLPVSLGVRCVADGSLRLARTENVSRGGAFIVSRRPPETGTLVSLWLSGPDERVVDLDAEVVWRRPNGPDCGFGVRFLMRNQRVQSSLSEMLDDVKVRLADAR